MVTNRMALFGAHLDGPRAPQIRRYRCTMSTDQAEALKGTIMRNKLCKLALAAALLTGSLTLGLTPKAAHAALGCQPICCNASCTSVRDCFGRPGSCICQAACHPVIQN